MYALGAYSVKPHPSTSPCRLPRCEQPSYLPIRAAALALRDQHPDGKRQLMSPVMTILSCVLHFCAPHGISYPPKRQNVDLIAAAQSYLSQNSPDFLFGQSPIFARQGLLGSLRATTPAPNSRLLKKDFWPADPPLQGEHRVVLSRYHATRGTRPRYAPPPALPLPPPNRVRRCLSP
jgi:hypothetical protein